MSMVPMAGNKFSANPWMVDHLPEIYMSMGLTAEWVYQKYGISREDQDQFAFAQSSEGSQRRRRGKFDDEIVPVEVETTTLEDGQACDPQHHVPQGRRPARGHVDGSAGEAEARVSCQRDGDGGQLIANQRRRGGGVGDVGGEGRGTGLASQSPLRELRRSRSRAGNHGDGSGARRFPKL